MLFNEIDIFIEVYNNSVIELIHVQCFGTSFFGRIDYLASSVMKFLPKNSVPKYCIRSIAYYYPSMLSRSINVIYTSIITFRLWISSINVRRLPMIPMPHIATATRLERICEM